MQTQSIRYFYRNIVKYGDKYRIKHKNKDYGEFSKLSDALYERDCLIYCKFDYDLLVECDLPNKYENMELPPFPEKRPKGQIKGIKFNKKEREGEIIFDHKNNKFCVKRGDEHYGRYDTMVEAYYIKKTLMKNHWDRTCLIQNKTIRQNILINKKVTGSEPKFSIEYCPNCGNKVKKDEIICPICGIQLNE